MTDASLKDAIAEALQACRKPLTAAEKAERERNIFGGTRYPHSEYGCVESGAVRRASMDLTRALARLRR